MAQKVGIPFSNWNAGSLHFGLYRFLNSAYQEEMDILQTAAIYNDVTFFLMFEARTNHIHMAYDQLTTLMLPVTTEYLLPYGAEESLPEWQQATSNSIRDYVSQWCDEFLASPECAPLLEQAMPTELQLYIMLFADSLYNQQRKTLKNAGLKNVAALLADFFPGLLLKQPDYRLIAPTLTAFFNFTKRAQYMRSEHVDRMSRGLQKGVAEMMSNLKQHDWYAFPKRRYAVLEHQYQNGGDSDWVRELFQQTTH